MVTVRFSKSKELILPRSLGESLGLREGDRVQVQRQDDVLRLHRGSPTAGIDSTFSPGPLTDLAKVISSSHSVGSVNIEQYMNKHGYEQVYGGVNS